MRVIFIILLTIVGTSGCKSPNSVSQSNEEIHIFGKSRYIRNTNAINERVLLNVKVVGYVTRPGDYQLPKGSTVLSAIKMAGEFASTGWPTKLRVKQNGKDYLLKLRQETGKGRHKSGLGILILICPKMILLLRMAQSFSL